MENVGLDQGKFSSAPSPSTLLSVRTVGRKVSKSVFLERLLGSFLMEFPVLLTLLITLDWTLQLEVLPGLMVWQKERRMKWKRVIWELVLRLGVLYIF